MHSSTPGEPEVIWYEYVDAAGPGWDWAAQKLCIQGPELVRVLFLIFGAKHSQVLLPRVRGEGGRRRMRGFQG